MELIDKEVLIKAIKDKFGTHCEDVSSDNCLHYENCLECVAHNAPTIDAVPVVRGHWIPHEWDSLAGKVHFNGYVCSKCGNRKADKSNYCPNCGADMRGENNGTD